MEEFELDLRCIAAPVRDSEGAVIAAISLSGPSNRLLDTKMDDIAINLVKTALTNIQTVGI